MRRGVVILLLVTIAIMMVMAAPAFAKTGTKSGGYWPYSANYENTGKGAFYTTLRINGAEQAFEMSGETTGSPHNGLPTSTGKCKVCHAVHGAGIATNLDASGNVVTEKLLRSTVADACVFCHLGAGAFAPDPYNTPSLLSDGLTLSTSLQNYYSNENSTAYPWGDASYPRSGHNATHGHDNPQTIPAGGSKSYKGCVSCHSIHGANTIAGSMDILKNDPARGTTSQAATGWGYLGRGYGSIYAPVTTQADFCADCHDGTKLVGPWTISDPAKKVKVIVSQTDFKTYFPSCGNNSNTDAACHNSVQQNIGESIAQFGAFNNSMHNGRTHIMTTVLDAKAQDGSGIAGSMSGVPVDGATAATNGCTLCHNINQDIAAGATFPHFGGNTNELIQNFPDINAPDQVCRRCHAGVGTTF